LGPTGDADPLTEARPTDARPTVARPREVTSPDW
jgi:hypothetical protein